MLHNEDNGRNINSDLLFYLISGHYTHDVRSHTGICYWRIVRSSCHYAMCLRDQWWFCGPRRHAVDSRPEWLYWTCGCRAPSPCAYFFRALSSWPCASPRPACVQRAATANATLISMASMLPAVSPASKRFPPASRWILSCWDWTTTR